MPEGLLEGRDTFIERISSQDVLIRHFRLGVTELTAMTWLPNLVKSIKADYSGINIEPVVESSSALFDRLMEDTIDMIVIPDVFNDSRCVSEPLGLVENAWMCSHDLNDSDTPLSLSDLANFTMLVQGNKSGTGLVYGRWLSSQGITPSKTINCGKPVGTNRLHDVRSGGELSTDRCCALSHSGWKSEALGHAIADATCTLCPALSA